MKSIQLPVAELKPALTGLAKVISRKTTLPILGAVLVTRDQDGWVTLTGTDLDSFLTVRLEQPQEEGPAMVLIPHSEIWKLAFTWTESLRCAGSRVGESSRSGPAAYETGFRG